MRNELLVIVLEAQEFVTVLVDVGGELVLDALPGGDVGGVLVAVLPDGAPGLEDGAGRGGADLDGGGEAGVEDAPDHEGMGIRVEGVELGGDVGLRGDVDGLGFGVGFGVRVWDVVVFVGGVGGRGGGGAEEVDFRGEWEDDVVCRE